MRKTVEIKARCDEHERVRAVLLAEGARFAGGDQQVDTYFRVPNGRLKLREGTIEFALIHYDRPDQAGPKRSDVTLYAPEPGAPLRAVLEKALGVLVVVEKHREIWFAGNVKIHLDRLEGHGRFVEIEAIDNDGSRDESALLAQCRHYLERFGIADGDLVAGSYSDMVLGAATT